MNGHQWLSAVHEIWVLSLIRTWHMIKTIITIINMIFTIICVFTLYLLYLGCTGFRREFTLSLRLCPWTCLAWFLVQSKCLVNSIWKCFEGDGRRQGHLVFRTMITLLLKSVCSMVKQKKLWWWSWTPMSLQVLTITPPSQVIMGQLQAKTSLSVPQKASFSQDFPGGSEVGT